MNDSDVVDALLEGAPDLLTTEEVADLLRVTQPTVLGWCRKSGLRSIAVGSRVRRVRRADLRDFLINNDDSSDSGSPESGEE